MYRGADKDMRNDDNTKKGIGTILVKAFLDENGNLEFKTNFGGFERCPDELKQNEIFQDIFKLNEKLKKRSLTNEQDKYDSTSINEN